MRKTAFTKALYYPHIDIKDCKQLKTAVLFWDEVSTIVPESVRQPYKQRDTEYLADIGFLSPIVVNSDDESVIDIEDDIIKLVISRPFVEMLLSPQNMRSEGIFHEKVSNRMREMFEYIHEIMGWRNTHYRDGQYFFDDSFSYLYMTALANKICEREGLALLTNEAQLDSVVNQLRLDNSHPMIFDREYHRMFRRPRNLRRERQFEQGYMLNLIIEGLRISPDVPLSDIIAFKEREGEKGELGRFRAELAKLTQGIFAEDKPFNAFRQEMEDLYKTEFLPAYNDFKKTLSGSRIKWFADNIVKISAISASSTGIPLMLGASVPQAILALAGVSLVATTVSYNVDKQQRLQNNPYSYLLAAEREFC